MYDKEGDWCNYHEANEKYKAAEQRIKTLEDENQVYKEGYVTRLAYEVVRKHAKTLDHAIREHKETLLTADWNSEDERDTILVNNDNKLHSVLRGEV